MAIGSIERITDSFFDGTGLTLTVIGDSLVKVWRNFGYMLAFNTLIDVFYKQQRNNRYFIE
ncbi:hypothetical protein TW81_00180 [Vibrio galatheae]|uniref:Uncharacterized protein n=1 Tax=Vibrio galatheae TaxID=579748 RepID=A0A0F4NRF6_9VIBR|nr:hypothetical protein TW81_00180 [Vibrio galatheae]